MDNFKEKGRFHDVESSVNISVVIPAYNVEAYVSEAIQSALDQRPEVREVVVVDDGSTDSTHDAVAAIRDDRVVYIHQNNSGPGAARNKGVSWARGDFILFLDADDVLRPGLTAAYAHAVSEFGPIDALMFSAKVIGSWSGAECPEPEGKYLRKRPGFYESGRDLLDSELQARSYTPCPYLYIFARSLVVGGESPLLFPPVLHEDEVFTPLLMMRCGRSVVLEESFYSRRVRDGSIMRQPHSMANAEGYAHAAVCWFDIAEKEDEGWRHDLYVEYALKMYFLAARTAISSGEGIGAFVSLMAGVAPRFSRMAWLDYGICKVFGGRARRLLFRMRVEGRTGDFDKKRVKP